MKTTNPKEDKNLVKQTDAAVKQLTQEGNLSQLTWIKRGKIIADYVSETKQSEDDSFRLLAAHPDSPVGASSLRGYYASYLLWQEIGETEIPPELNYTSFTVVAGAAGLTFPDRVDLLKKAKKYGWSISELKRQIADIRRPSPKDTGKKLAKQREDSIDWKSNVENFNTKLAGLIPLLVNLSWAEGSTSIREDAKNNIRTFVGLLITKKLVERTWILDQMQETQDGEAA